MIHFGCFVFLISKERVESVDKVLSEGQIVKVKVIEIDRQKRIRLSMKAIEKDSENESNDTEESTEEVKTEES